MTEQEFDPHKCVRYLVGRKPSKENFCQQCSVGPCPLSIKPSWVPRKKKLRRRRKFNPRGKPFPRVKTTEQYMGVHNSGYKPEVVTLETLTYESGGIWSETSSFFATGCMYHSELLVELNRLPNARGTQCIHGKIFMEAAAIDGLGDMPFWVKYDDTPPGFPGTRVYTVSYSRTYLESFLVNALSFANIIDHEDLLPLSLQPEITVAEAAAFNAMRPSFTTGFSMLNFLLELEDMKTLVPNILGTLNRLTKNVSATLKVMGDLSKEFRNRRLPDLNRATLNEILNGMAEAKLTKDFGIEPFIKDIDTFWTTLGRFEKNLKKFKEGAESLGLIRHFKASLQASTEYKESFTRLVHIPLAGCTVTYECKVETFDSQSNGTPTDHVSYNATMEYTYACKTLMDMDPYVAALYTELGIKPDATILWNAIPFSFVVDWFINVQGFLDKYASVDLITSEVTIHSWLTSIRCRPVWTCVPVSVVWNDPSKEGLHLMPTIELRGQLYTRFLSNIDIEKLINLNEKTPDGLTLNRGLLSASLVKKILFR